MERILGSSYARCGRSLSLNDSFSESVIWRSIFKSLCSLKRRHKKNLSNNIQYCNRDFLSSAWRPWGSGDVPYLSCEVLAMTTARLLLLCRSVLSQELGINTFSLLQKLCSLSLGTRLTDTVKPGYEVYLQ